MKYYRVREKLHEELLPHLLLARGLDLGEHERFLKPDFLRDSGDPFLLPDMDAAVERLQEAKRRNERVAVWSDYDCDGIPGGVMLAGFLRTWGLEVVHYIPHRHKEGYGLNKEGIAELAAQKISLMITVDLGTTEVEEVAYARELGIDIIITDHHLVQEGHALPVAVALLNPKRPDSKYPFDGLCGAGVAWKLVQALLLKDRPTGFGEGQEKWLLDLVGIATLSDMVPLRGENRMLAQSGLLVMRRGRRPGISALLKLLRVKEQTLTEDDVTFMLSPRINAASRMDRPQTAAELLSAQTPEEGARLAAELNRINDERKGLVAATVKEVNKRLSGMDLAGPLIVMGSPKWRPGILGLVANKLMEAHSKTVFLWGREGGESIKGSCRAAPGVNVVELMAAARGAFSHFGGHAASGGFGLEEEKAHELPAKLLEAYAATQVQSAAEELLLDRELDLGELSHAHRALQRLSPFGVGFTKPLFLVPRVSITGSRMFGKAQDHLELTLSRGGERVSGISFFCAPGSFSKNAIPGETADIVGHVETDWRGQPRLRVVDVL